jgi:hypothetical protein
MVRELELADVGLYYLRFKPRRGTGEFGVETPCEGLFTKLSQLVLP